MDEEEVDEEEEEEEEEEDIQNNDKSLLYNVKHKEKIFANRDSTFVF